MIEIINCSYPYDISGLTAALKEQYGCISPVIQSSYKEVRREGTLLGGERELVYQFTCENGEKYQIKASGRQILKEYEYYIKLYTIVGIVKI